MSISLTATGFEQLERRLSADRFAAAMRRGLAEGARVIKNQLVGATPKGKTKKMSRSWHTRVVGSERVEITNDAPYARYVVQGTPKHIIRPRNKKALAFTAGGQRVVVRFVRHPGTKPNDFPSRVLRDGADQVNRVMRFAAEESLAGH